MWCASSGTSGRSSSASFPPDTELAPRNPGVKPWIELTADEQRLALRLQEAFAGFLEHTDAQIGRLVDYLKRERRARQHAVPADVGQRRQPGRRPARHGRLLALLQRPARDDRREHRAHRRDRHAGGVQQLSVGLGAGRQHAGQALQAEHPRRRHPRSADRALAGRHRRQGRHPPPVPPCHRHRADHLRGGRRHAARQSSTAIRRCRCTAPACSTRSRRRRRPRRRASRCSISRCSATAASGPTAGRPSPTTSRTRRATPTTGSSTTSTSDFSECRNLAEKNPEKLRELIERWWAEAGRNGVLPLDDRRAELWRPTIGLERSAQPRTLRLPAAGGGDPHVDRAVARQPHVLRDGRHRTRSAPRMKAASSSTATTAAASRCMCTRTGWCSTTICLAST